MTVLVGGCLQGWLLLTGLPWNLPAVPGICMGPPLTLDGTSSHAHQLMMSLTFERTCVLLSHYFGWTKQKCGCRKKSKIDLNILHAVERNLTELTTKNVC